MIPRRRKKVGQLLPFLAFFEEEVFSRAQNFEKSWIFVKTKKMRGATFPKATTRPSRGGDFPAILGLEK